MSIEVQRDTAIQKLREFVTTGATIYVVLRHKHQSGTCRWLEFYHVHGGGLQAHAPGSPQR